MRTTLKSILSAAALVLAVVHPAAAAPDDDPSPLEGTYVLDGMHDDVFPTHGKLTITREHGYLHVVRTIDGESGSAPLTLNADSSEVSGRKISVTFHVTTEGDTPGFKGKLERVFGIEGGRTRTTTDYDATYTFTNDGIRITEAVAATKPRAGVWKTITSQGSRDLRGLSYGEVARDVVPRVFDDLVANLDALGPNTPPPDVRDLRYKVAQLRDLVDIFAFAYPKDGKDDPYARLREQLNEGYEKLGAFKDLFDAQGVTDPKDAKYDPKQLKKLREAALEWQKEFRDPKNLADIRDYLESAKKNKLTDRDSGDLGRFFWNEAGIEPNPDLTGLENLARLERKLLDTASNDLDQVTELRKIHKGDALSEFHDFRKQLRVATKIGAYFPQIFEAGDPQSNLALLIDAVDRFGAVHDKIVAYDIAKEHGDDEKADALIDEIAADWKDLRRWQADQGIGDAILERRKALIDEESDLER
jgi:hypothetical protein